MERLTTKRPWEEAKEDLTHEYGYSHIWKRLHEIEDILGDEYDLDELREKMKVEPAVKCKDCKHAWHSADGLRCEFFGTYECDPLVMPQDSCSHGAIMDEEIT